MSPHRPAAIAAAVLGLAGAPAAAPGEIRPPPPVDEELRFLDRAPRPPPMTVSEAKAFMGRLARFVEENHLRKDPGSPVRGMVYEYFDVRRKGEFDQWVQGEALDTMHDGAWLAAAMAAAFRATGDPAYRDFLVRWQLPFYLDMLNGSDRLFAVGRNDARPGVPPFDREHALQAGEKGFVPYFRDDGGSVSLERTGDGNPLGVFPCVDDLAGKPNPRFVLAGYSLGSSNHMAQDLGVMVLEAWLLLRSSPEHRALAGEVAEGAANLHACRMRHHGLIPMCAAPAAVAAGDAELLDRVPAQDAPGLLEPDDHYYRALYAFEPGKRMPFPGFADDQEYRWYSGTARHRGRLPRPLAWRTIYDAHTEPILYRTYCDDRAVPPGINVFDLYPYCAVDGKPEDYRSDRKGPGGRPKPAGSRFGPQNMVAAGWALQALAAYPGIWEEPYRARFSGDVLVPIDDPPRAGTERPAPALFDLAGARLEVIGTRRSLCVSGVAAGATLAIAVHARPDGAGTRAEIRIAAGRPVEAANGAGEELIVIGGPARTVEETRPAGWHAAISFRFEIPYTLVKDQRPWANGVEHGRLSIRIGGQIRNLYLMSPEAQVRAWLERELGGGLRTWEAVFDRLGYIPTGIGAGPRWDRFSDAGGYAHLIAAGARWIQYIEGRRDWEDLWRGGGLPAEKGRSR